MLGTWFDYVLVWYAVVLVVVGFVVGLFISWLWIAVYGCCLAVLGLFDNGFKLILLIC